MNVLGLDPGTSFGFAVFSDGKLATFGEWNLKPKRHEGGGMRFVRLKAYLSELLDENKIDLIFYELVRRHAGTDAAHVYGGLLGALTALAEERGLPYRGVPVGTCKKAFCGKGNASKQMMIDEASRRFGIAVTDNEADAMAVALAGMASL